MVYVNITLEILLFHYVFSHFSSVPWGTESSEEEDESGSSSSNAIRGVKQQNRGGISLYAFIWLDPKLSCIYKITFFDPAQLCSCCSSLPYTLTFSIFSIPRGHLNIKKEQTRKTIEYLRKIYTTLLLPLSHYKRLTWVHSLTLLLNYQKIHFCGQDFIHTYATLCIFTCWLTFTWSEKLYSKKPKYCKFFKNSLLVKLTSNFLCRQLLNLALDLLNCSKIQQNST